MKELFPSAITQLPEADIPMPGLTAYLSQGSDHQIIFMQFDEDTVLPEHSHKAQVGFVLAGKIEMTISGETNSYSKGDIYFIPEGALHSGKIFAGYADITFFADVDRYNKK